MGSYYGAYSDFKDIDLQLDQVQEDTLYGELVYDRSFFTGRGLFTAGASYRRKDIDNAPDWDFFLPDFLGPDNEVFAPKPDTDDYTTNLGSLFGQYRQKIANFDLWAGLRY